MAEFTREQQLAVAWSDGDLSYLFKNRPGQVEIYRWARAYWLAGKGMLLAILFHRRWGKSRFFCAIGLEECIRRRRTNVVYLTETKDQAETIIIPLITEIIQDCPKAMRPAWRSHKQAWVFPNGSTLRVYGTAMDAIDKGRGVGARLLIIDEAGKLNELGRALEVFLPLLGTTGGICLMGGTPPDRPGMMFETLFPQCERDGCGRKIRLSDNRDAPADLKKAANEYRKLVGEAAYLREFECVMGAFETEELVIPEFTPNRDHIVRTYTVPGNADRYVSLDVGGRDLHGVLFGSYDFGPANVVIQGAILTRNITTPELVRAIKAMEAKIWGEEPIGRITRVADNNNQQLLKDMSQLHGLNFKPTFKTDKDAALRAVRTLVVEDHLVILPHVVELIETLVSARWNKDFTTYLRGKPKPGQINIGHADLLDALVYFVRNIHRNHNPAPMAQPVHNVFSNIKPPERANITSGRPPSANAQKLAKHLQGMFSGRGRYS